MYNHKPYIVRVTALVPHTRPDGARETIRVTNMLNAFSLEDAKTLCNALTSEYNDIRRECEIVVKTYVGGKNIYIPLHQLKRLATDFGDMYAEYAEEQEGYNIETKASIARLRPANE